MSIYTQQSPESIRATVALLRHFRAFLRSDYAEMRDPFEIESWGAAADRLTKPQAQRRLTWLIQIAIQRKAGWIDDPHSREIIPGFNHRGKLPRFRTGDAQRHLHQLAHRINQPRLIVRPTELGEWGTYLRRNLPARFEQENNP